MKEKLSAYFMLFSFSLLIFFPGYSNAQRNSFSSDYAETTVDGEESLLEILLDCLQSGVSGVTRTTTTEEEHHSHEDGSDATTFIISEFAFLLHQSEKFEIIKTYNLCLNKGYQFMVFAPPEAAMFIAA